MKPELIATLLGILSYSTLELKDGQVSLSKEEVEKIKSFYQDKFGAELTLEGLEYDEDNYASFYEAEILTIEESLNAEPPAQQQPNSSNDDPKEGPESAAMQKTIKELSAKVKKLEEREQQAQQTIIKLSKKPEPDLTPEPVNPQGGHMQIVHSKTHLFASGKPYDAFENRPWNKKLKDRLEGKKVSATDFTDLDFSKVNEDLGAYWRENKEDFISFLRGLSRLPDNWDTISNIQDEVVYTKLFVGEITQARKRNWMPKGKFEFQPEIAKVFPNQIDIEFEGYWLQQMETSWMNRYVKSDGSSPFKMSFVAYLSKEILKKAAEEDEIGHIKGIYVKPADDDTVPGSYLRKQDGFLKIVKKAQKDLKYMPYSLGTPTDENIVDYVEGLVERIPEYWRDLPNMIVYMSAEWELKYKKRREELFGLMPTYQPGKMTIRNHENFTIKSLPFLGSSDFMCATPSDNISKLENLPNEKTFLQLEKSKRNIAIYGDYKIGIHVWAFGKQYDSVDELTDEKQMFFSNDVPILSDEYIKMDPNDTTPSVKIHTSIQTGVNTEATAITNIDDADVGDFIYIKGNTGSNNSTIANGGNFDLASNITLTENTILVLYKRGANDFTEVKRIDTTVADFVTLAADATTADAADGTHFLTSANSGATAITTIENAVEGETYRIEGGSDTNASTIAASGDFSRITAGITLEKGNWIDVYYNGDKFIEMKRNVA